MTEEPENREDTVEVFKSADGDWWWHRKAANGEIVSDSGEGYERPGYAVHAALRANKDIAKAEIVESFL